MDWRLLAIDALVLIGVAGLTLSVLGILRLPDTFARVHAGSNGVVVGVSLVLAAALFGGAAMATRAVLVGVLLLVTTTVGAHALARLASRGATDQRPR